MKISGSVHLNFNEEGMKLEVKDFNINNFCIDNVFKHIDKKLRKSAKKEDKKVEKSKKAKKSIEPKTKNVEKSTDDMYVIEINV